VGTVIFAIDAEAGNVNASEADFEELRPLVGFGARSLLASAALFGELRRLGVLWAIGSFAWAARSCGKAKGPRPTSETTLLGLRHTRRATKQKRHRESKTDGVRWMVTPKTQLVSPAFFHEEAARLESGEPCLLNRRRS
jgi:hypothetical protein